MAKQVKNILSTEQPAQAAQAAPAQPAAEPRREYPADFEGLPYKQIVKKLLEGWGVYGEPAVGNRNTMLYRLARLMRYICDFQADHLLAVIPQWGLSEQERRQAVVSAVGSPRGTDMPYELRYCIDTLRGQQTGSADEEQPAEDEPNPIPANLPRLLRIFVKRNPRNRKAALLSCLPVLGCLLTRLRSEYRDGNEESPIFMVVINGPQASGKSFIKEIYYRLAAPMLKNDQEQMQKEREYLEKVRRAKNQKQQPERETFAFRCLEAFISNTQLLKRVDQNNGLAVISFAPEIDTVTRGNRSGSWADKGEIYRNGFEGGLYGQDMASDNSYSGRVELRYNLLFSGTNQAVAAFFRNVENGMTSRFAFAQMADDRGQKIQRRPKMSASDDDFVTSEVNRLYEMGSNPDPAATVSFSLPRVCAAIDQWEDERIQEYLETGDVAMDILRRRAALLGFRAGMVGWALAGGETRAVVDLALWVATEVLNQQLALFGHKVNEQALAGYEERERGQNRLLRSKNTRLFSQLPDLFRKEDLQLVRRKNNMGGECSYILTRWVQNGMVERLKDGSFKKLADHPIVVAEKGGEA